MRRVTLLLVCLLLPPPASPGDEPPGKAVPLFDGKTLDGWKRAGGNAVYRVDGDCIVGEVPEGGLKSNAFLCSQKEYGNFVLELDQKFDVPGNSGIQLRSHVSPQGRVFGYQCEIDPLPRAWSGGIYDEGRRGWLNDLKDNEPGRKAFKVDDWNHFKIHAEGPHLRTWVNGVPCADLLDPVDAEGFIALQVHGGAKGRIRWKNILLTPLPASKYVSLFDGKTLAGWRKTGGGEWKAEDGVLHGTSKAGEKRHGHLVTEKGYADFVVRLQYRADRGNSGLYFRIQEVPGDVGVKGFQAEIDPANDVGGLYETHGRGWVVKPKAEDVKKWHKAGEWNEMAVVAKGDRVVVTVNGKRTAELKKDAGRKEGPIALQLHGGQDMDVRFRNIEVLPLR
jgi:hypothetical protein